MHKTIKKINVYIWKKLGYIDTSITASGASIYITNEISFSLSIMETYINPPTEVYGAVNSLEVLIFLCLEYL